MKKTVTNQRANWEEIADALKSVAHSGRLAILNMLCNCGCDLVMVKDIYHKLHLDQSSTSRNLGIMKKGGLLKREVKKGKTYYGMNNSNFTARCLTEMLKHIGQRV